jgi:hypothetical protein
MIGPSSVTRSAAPVDLGSWPARSPPRWRWAVATMQTMAPHRRIGDTGSSAVDPTEVVTALEGLTARAGAAVDVTRVPGTTIGPEELEISAWDGEVEGLVHAFYPGSEGGNALADVLFGDQAPSGRLPFSMPEAETDLPPFDNMSRSVVYDYFHGYRHLLREETAARYPFGFGLSYTAFAHSELALDRDRIEPDGQVTARVTVTNIRPVAGLLRRRGSGLGGRSDHVRGADRGPCRRSGTGGDVPGRRGAVNDPLLQVAPGTPWSERRGRCQGLPKQVRAPGAGGRSG